MRNNYNNQNQPLTLSLSLSLSTNMVFKLKICIKKKKGLFVVINLKGNMNPVPKCIDHPNESCDKEG